MPRIYVTPFQRLVNPLASPTPPMKTPLHQSYARRRKHLPSPIAKVDSLPLPTNPTHSGALAISRSHPLLRPTNPINQLASPSTTNSKYEVFTQPSGFKNVHESQLPLCPHYANPCHTEFECRMRACSHQRNSHTFVYLQVPRSHHQCSFIGALLPLVR
jgi:hypothetical protein